MATPRRPSDDQTPASHCLGIRGGRGCGSAGDLRLPKFNLNTAASDPSWSSCTTSSSMRLSSPSSSVPSTATGRTQSSVPHAVRRCRSNDGSMPTRLRLIKQSIFFAAFGAAHVAFRRAATASKGSVYASRAPMSRCFTARTRLIKCTSLLPLGPMRPKYCNSSIVASGRAAAGSTVTPLFKNKSER